MDDNLIPLNPDVQGITTRKMTEYFQERIKGQDRAIRYFLKRYDLYQAGLNDSNRPILSALFLGPSGVGKTLMVETLATYLFGSPHSMTKIACADYQEPHKIAALIGSPAGYIGFWQPNDPQDRGTEPILSQGRINDYDVQYQLQKRLGNKKSGNNIRTLLDRQAQLKAALKDARDDEVDVKTINNIAAELAKVKRQIAVAWSQVQDELNELKFRSVILFDEIEKANESVRRILLEILDKGRTTLSNGMTTDLTRSFIFMTSNIGSRDIADLLDGKSENMGFIRKDKSTGNVDQGIYETALAAVKREFATEFMGRINQVVVFRPLSPEVMKDILELHLQNLHTVLASSKTPILIKPDEKAKEYLIKKATKNSAKGARNIRDILDKYIKESIAELINCFRITKGDIVHIKVGTNDKAKDKLVFYREPRPDELQKLEASEDSENNKTEPTE
ncbi:MAG: AAA family ATPase [Patescibacteria group bacterium]